MEPQSIINNLQVKLSYLNKENNALIHENNELQGRIKELQHSVEVLQSQSPHGNAANFQILHLMEQKLQATTQQVIELQKLNLNNENIIKQLQTQIVHYGRELTIKNQQVQQLIIEKENTIKMNSNEAQIAVLLQQWQKSSVQKLHLVQENIRLNSDLEVYKKQTYAMMENFLTQIHEMRRKIDSRINPQSEEFQGISKLVEQFKKENERLGQKVMERDEQILRINELINITDSQYSDRHTIESLRNQLKKKSKKIADILERLSETEELRKKFIEFDELYLKSQGQLRNMTAKYDQIYVEKVKLEQELQSKVRLVECYDEDSRRENQIKLQLLVENEACHSLLFRIRGHCDIYKKDILQEIQAIARNLQKRKKLQKWTDVSQLLQVNRKMRLRMIH